MRLSMIRNKKYGQPYRTNSIFKLWNPILLRAAYIPARDLFLFHHPGDLGDPVCSGQIEARQSTLCINHTIAAFSKIQKSSKTVLFKGLLVLG